MEQLNYDELYEELSMLTGMLDRDIFDRDHVTALDALSRQAARGAERAVPTEAPVPLIHALAPRRRRSLPRVHVVTKPGASAAASVVSTPNGAEDADADSGSDFEELYQELAAHAGVLSAEIFKSELRQSLKLAAGLAKE